MTRFSVLFPLEHRQGLLAAGHMTVGRTEKIDARRRLSVQYVDAHIEEPRSMREVKQSIQIQRGGRDA